MKRILNVGVFLFYILSNSFATHNRAGEITYRHLSGYTYEFTITTYTWVYSPVRRTELPVVWGDGTTTNVQKVPANFIQIPNTDYFFNTYIGQHTYPGAGIYKILMEDPNRNQGVLNIPNSVNTIFSIETTMLVGSDIGSNNAPVLLNPPIDKAAKGHIFIHNPGAFDRDGDSLSYAITTCLGAGGQPIDGYVLPAATDTIEMNEITGDLIWITPAEVGKFNIAILVDEWRKGIRVSRIERDMQIDVYDSKNNPPVNPKIKDYCVQAGDTIDFDVTATDPDNDAINMEMSGGPFQIANPAIFSIISGARGSMTGHFRWLTDCSHVREQPYYVLLKSNDVNVDISLVDITNFSIRVLPKAPEHLKTIPGVDTIRLEWDPSKCGNPAGYKIYRRIGYYGFIPDSCENGVPASTGYRLIKTVEGGSLNSFTDDDNGNGLVPGNDYCYMITAYYADGAESFATKEVCATLVAGTPPILRVSVGNDDAINGKIELAWAVPKGIDTLSIGPFQYEVLRKAPGQANFTSITKIPTVDLKDTTYTDLGINTLVFPYTYEVILYYLQNSNWIPVPGNETATSQYLTFDGANNQLTLNMKKRSPWLNNLYQVYRENKQTLTFDSIGSTDQNQYIDQHLTNNVNYTYRTIGYGSRPLFGAEYKVINRSHLGTGMPLDTIPPCPPVLTVISECDSVKGYNSLTWTIPDSCKNDETVAYKVYFRSSLDGNFELLDSLPPNQHAYNHYSDSTIEGCYAVTAIDSSKNESAKKPICVFNICNLFRLPNVFTPNGDNIHDYYESWNFNNTIKKVEMTIYNRYGLVVFKTNDPAIKWDGRYKENGKIVPTGVYYYMCNVYEPRISGTVVHTLTGFIHVFTGESNAKAE
jgi:gliding motility-associated-like protein